MVAARENHHRAAVLLRAVEMVWERIVGRYVVELPGRLVEPRRPGRAGVEAHARPLIAGQRHTRRIGRIDPELVKVVATRRALDRGKMSAAVGRAVERGVRDVDQVGVLRIDRHMAKIPAAFPQTPLAAGQAPGRAAVIAAIEPAGLRVEDRVDTIWIARCNRDADLAYAFACQ